MLRGAAAAEAVQVVGTPRLRRLGQPARTAFLCRKEQLADNRKRTKGSDGRSCSSSSRSALLSCRVSGKYRVAGGIAGILGMYLGPFSSPTQPPWSP
jgi:hypothetical protein